MSVSLNFMRILYMLLSVFFMSTYMVATNAEHNISNLLTGIISGGILGIMLIGFDILFRKFNLRSFNTAALGLLIGYLMAKAVMLLFNEALILSNIANTIDAKVLDVIKLSIFLVSTYLGSLMTLRAADELYVSIPFIRFAPTTHKKKDFLVDLSTLSDPRIYDLCATGILDQQLVIPQFIMKELYAQSESSDESIKVRARKTLENLKRLQSIESMGIRYNETDFPEVKDFQGKIQRLARLLNANILISDVSRIQISSIDGIKLINLNTLSNALKPLMQAGEVIRIKIQRIGKEPRQGVGYLDDGTMVVVNGGGHYLGDTIEARVLSVKHTTSGRMIFCNALDDEFEERLEHEEVYDEHR